MILDMNLTELTEYVKNLQEPAYRAKQLYEGCMLGKNLEEISNLPKTFKEQGFCKHKEKRYYELSRLYG